MNIPRTTPLQKLTTLALGAVLLIFFLGRNFIGTREFVRFSLEGQELTAVVSRRPSEITLGLSGREEIGADAMLFLLPQASRHLFWMNGMRFPLDFIWLRDGKVVDLHRNVPVPRSAGVAEIPTVTPAVPADSVLEVPAGFIEANGVTTGQDFQLTSSFFRQMW